MPILLNWYDATQRIILVEMQGALGWEAMQQSRNILKNLVHSVQHTVCLICVLSPDMSVPPSGFAEDSKIAFQQHAAINLSDVIYVTRDASTKALWQSVIEIYGSPSVKYHFTSSLDDALHLIN